MSISLKVVSMAYVFCAPFSRSATRALSLVIFTRLRTIIILLGRCWRFVVNLAGMAALAGRAMLLCAAQKCKL